MKHLILLFIFIYFSVSYAKDLDLISQVVPNPKTRKKEFIDYFLQRDKQLKVSCILDTYICEPTAPAYRVEGTINGKTCLLVIKADTEEFDKNEIVSFQYTKKTNCKQPSLKNLRKKVRQYIEDNENIDMSAYENNLHKLYGDCNFIYGTEEANSMHIFHFKHKKRKTSLIYAIATIGAKYSIWDYFEAWHNPSLGHIQQDGENVVLNNGTTSLSFEPISPPPSTSHLPVYKYTEPSESEVIAMIKQYEIKKYREEKGTTLEPEEIVIEWDVVDNGKSIFELGVNDRVCYERNKNKKPSDIIFPDDYKKIPNEECTIRYPFITISGFISVNENNNLRCIKDRDRLDDDMKQHCCSIEDAYVIDPILNKILFKYDVCKTRWKPY